MPIKIAVITATRAEYGLLYPLIKELLQNSEFELQVIATGTHLLERFGKTIDTIYADNIPVAYKIPIMSEENEGMAAIIAKGILKFSKLYEEEAYDAIIVLGDRYELYSFCIPAIMLNIPVVHLHGGEKTEGAVDERIRHSITKMASLHFPSLPLYARRIIQMGENPEYVHPVGALGIDNIINLVPLKKYELEEELGINLEESVALVTFHPVTLDTTEEIKNQGIELFEALVESKMQCIVTMPNNDAGSKILNGILEEYVEKYPEKFVFRRSLGQLKYLSLLKYVKMVIGNSSSGLIEVPSFKIPTINIGDRQRGRFSPETVIHCECQKDEILKAIRYGNSEEFRVSIKSYESPYGMGNTAKKIVEILKKTDFKSEKIVKKEFFDVEFRI